MANLEENELTGVDPEAWESLPGLSLGRRYAHAPIVQAILELRVTSRDDVTVDDLSMVVTEPDYAEPQPIVNVEGEFSYVDGAVVGSTRGDKSGSVFNRKDGGRTVLADVGRFGFIWRDPYTHWDDFIAEAEARWLDYRRVASPKAVEGVGVRFVNEIPLPRHAIEIKDYLRTSVDISPYLPQEVAGLFMQVDIPIRSVDAVATVTSSLLGQGTRGGGQALLLDIDVKSDVRLVTSDDGFDQQLRTRLTTLRRAKNYVFEACITDATRGLIE